MRVEPRIGCQRGIAREGDRIGEPDGTEGTGVFEDTISGQRERIGNVGSIGCCQAVHGELATVADGDRSRAEGRAELRDDASGIDDGACCVAIEGIVGGSGEARTPEIRG